VFDVDPGAAIGHSSPETGYAQGSTVVVYLIQNAGLDELEGCAAFFWSFCLPPENWPDPFCRTNVQTRDTTPYVRISFLTGKLSISVLSYRYMLE
jgi:hypothetical protein